MTPIERLVLASAARAAAASRDVSALIEALAGAAFARVWQFLVEHPGASPREAIQAAQVEFGGAFAEALSEAFSDLLQRSVGVAEVLAMPVSGLALSRRLYLHNAETTAQVLGLIREHAQGITQARELARRLYDGYDPRDGVRRPLEGRARGELPAALRALTADPAARESLTALMVRGQRQAERLKSKALRVAYLEAFDAWAQGKGAEALQRKLRVAQLEKNRFLADRIAQTELHRAHQAKVADELRADELTTVVQVRMSASHPRPDICDLFARANLFGLGPGLYPKSKAPVPPFHPFCRCGLKPKPSMDAASARPVQMGEAAFLRELGEERAAQVMGSAARAKRVRDGAPVDLLLDAGRDPMYRMRRIGDG